MQHYGYTVLWATIWDWSDFSPCREHTTTSANITPKQRNEVTLLNNNKVLWESSPSAIASLSLSLFHFYKKVEENKLDAKDHQVNVHNCSSTHRLSLRNSLSNQHTNNKSTTSTTDCGLLFRPNFDGPNRQEKVFFKPDLVDMMFFFNQLLFFFLCKARYDSIDDFKSSKEE